jgi:hypothetical protein
MTYALTFQPFANTNGDDVGFIPISQTTGSSWWGSSVQPERHDEASVKRILAAKNAKPVTVLAADEVMDWLHK